jgi:cytoskeletal protein RodZ
MTPSAAFSTCAQSLSAGCIDSLLQETSNDIAAGTYKVTLLLPACPAVQAFQQPDNPAQDLSKQRADMQNSSSSDIPDRDSDNSSALDENSSSNTAAAAAAAVQPKSPTPVQRSGLQGMLLTVHVEQEVAGQVHLAEVTQYVPAGEKGMISS